MDLTYSHNRINQAALKRLEELGQQAAGNRPAIIDLVDVIIPDSPQKQRMMEMEPQEVMQRASQNLDPKEILENPEILNVVEQISAAMQD